MDFLPLLQAIAWFYALFIIFQYLLIIWANSNKSKRAAGPPKPAGCLPLLGHLHLFWGPEPTFRKLAAMADQYGPTLMLRIGIRRLLMVSSWEAVKDCFTTNDKALSTRPITAAGEHMGYNYAVLGFAPFGPYWRELRKVAMQKILSNARLDALKHVRATEIHRRMGNLYRLWSMDGGSAVSVDLKKWCGDLTLDIVVKMVVGKRCLDHADYDDGDGSGGDDNDDSQARRFQRALGQFFHLIGVFVVSDALPFLKWFDFQGHMRTMKSIGREFDSLLSKWLDEHRMNRSKWHEREDDQMEEDFMDVMLSITEKDQISGYDPDTIIKATCLSMILGGTDTTSITLARAIALVLANPQALKKAQDELDIHVGRARNVDESDINNLVYLQAIVKETLRISPPASLSIARETMHDCQIDGYHVPSGTHVIVNIWKLQHDPRVWPDPSEFRPERFLTSHAGVEPRGQHFEFVPFGSGRRACPGISFALHVDQLALARVIHGFDLASPCSDGAFKMGQALGLGSRNNSDPIRVLFTPRLPPKLYEFGLTSP